jgi:hypothetical protein
MGSGLAEVEPMAFEKRLVDVILRNGGLQIRLKHLIRAQWIHRKCFSMFRGGRVRRTCQECLIMICHYVDDK